MNRTTFVGLCVLGMGISLAVACSRSTADAPASKTVTSTTPDYQLTATIKDLMDSEVDPASDYLWDSVSTTVSRKGVEENRPRTDEDWKEVRRRAITLIESANLLVMPGRRVAKTGEKADNPNVELSPEEIQQVIDGDRATFIQRAHQLQDAAKQMLDAIDRKDVDGLSNAGVTVDKACEQCHLKYWYPPEVLERLKPGAGSVRQGASQQ
jgi:cytochrome c556